MKISLSSSSLWNIEEGEEKTDDLPGLPIDSDSPSGEVAVRPISRVFGSQEFNFQRQPHRVTLDEIDFRRPDFWLTTGSLSILIIVIILMDKLLPSNTNNFTTSFIVVFAFIYLTTIVVDLSSRNIRFLELMNMQQSRMIVIPLLLGCFSCLYFIGKPFSYLMLYSILKRLIVIVLMVPWCVVAESARTKIRSVLYSYMLPKDFLSVNTDKISYTIVRADKLSKIQSLDLLLRDMVYLKEVVRTKKTIKLNLTFLSVLALFASILFILWDNVLLTSFDIFLLLETKYLIAINSIGVITYNEWINKLEDYHSLRTGLGVKLKWARLRISFFGLNFANLVFVLILVATTVSKVAV